MEFKNRLIALRDEKGFNNKSLSLAAGLNETAMRDILARAKHLPRLDTIEKIAQALRVPVVDIVGEGAYGVTDITHGPGSITLREVPVIDIVQAGSFNEAANPYPLGEGFDSIYVPYSHNRVFAVKVIGNSMNLEFPEGSTVVVDYTDTELVNRKYYVVRHHADTTLKQYRASPDRFEPRSTDPSFETIFPNGDMKVVGRVVQAVKSY